MPMVSHPIVTFPDEILLTKAVAVEEFDDKLEVLVQNLFDTLNAQDEGTGIGLSAPQIGVSKRVSVVHVPDDGYGPVAYINPVVLAKTAYGLVEESCLSVPGVEGNVIRATRVRVEAFDRSGERFVSEVDGMHAVCLLHEIDHLDGTLFIDRLFWPRRWRVKRQLRKQHRLAVMDTG
ncbi:MAG: peptide deformylase [Gammaproteobacteria bacterium]|nr:peptide deformylase [Gammaproteobacteria bacterium]